MPSRYCCLRGNVHQYLDTMNTVGKVALSRSCHAPSAYLPRIPVRYHVHADGLLHHYALDEYNAIRRIISY